MTGTLSGPRGIKEETIVAKTGKASNDWHALLDEWGAAAKGHTATARYLEESHHLSGWWAQTITVRYEWARDLRQAPSLEVPDDLRAALSGHPAAQARFDALPPSHRREYLEWITEAKKPETRARRIAKMLGELEATS
jgi:uncharacterized protein YdeI (YjbR/CyaY-like superfamily)